MTDTTAAAPPAPESQPLNGIKATMFHDEGAIAQCGSCSRYTLDTDALHQRFRLVCDCGDMHGWSGSFKQPGANAVWHGSAPLAQAAPLAKPEQKP